MADEKKEMEKFWNELMFVVCHKDAAQIKELSKFDIYDFFAFVENFRKDQK